MRNDYFRWGGLCASACFIVTAGTAPAQDKGGLSGAVSQLADSAAIGRQPEKSPPALSPEQIQALLHMLTEKGNVDLLKKTAQPAQGQPSPPTPENLMRILGGQLNTDQVRQLLHMMQASGGRVPSGPGGIAAVV